MLVNPLAMTAISLDELLLESSLTIVDLNVEITPNRYQEIACCLTEWKLVALKLTDFDESEIEAVEADNAYEERRRMSFLKRLKQKFSIRATYKLLVYKLLEIGRAEDARKLCSQVSRKLFGQLASYFIPSVTIRSMWEVNFTVIEMLKLANRLSSSSCSNNLNTQVIVKLYIIFFFF